MLAARILCLLLAFPTAALPSHEIPPQLRGTWIITRLIPTRTISCWGQREANRLLGTSVHYSTDSFQWKSYSVERAAVIAQDWTAEGFSREYSGGGAADSYVDFGELGIPSSTATVIIIQHPPADITGATVEIPGDWVLLKNRNTIILSVCNLYFEAHRR